MARVYENREFIPVCGNVSDPPQLPELTDAEALNRLKRRKAKRIQQAEEKRGSDLATSPYRGSPEELFQMFIQHQRTLGRANERRLAESIPLRILMPKFIHCDGGKEFKTARRILKLRRLESDIVPLTAPFSPDLWQEIIYDSAMINPTVLKQEILAVLKSRRDQAGIEAYEMLRNSI